MFISSGIVDAINSLPNGIKKNEQAIAETIENNVHQKIIKEHLIDPAFFEEMSKLLAEIIKERKTKAINYKKYLEKIEVLAEKVKKGVTEQAPNEINTLALKALYNNLNKNKELAIQIDKAVKKSKPDNWRGHQARENAIKMEINKILNNINEVERIFKIIKKQSEY
ncbi:MAG: hypothetical protein B6I26_02210 [Desulfobacteraceae bacterium 4572_130]|nr:MAG: hypothetical protein B6I26_02210 [Desulfobacteraceae bacterium 4572_130]